MGKTVLQKDVSVKSDSVIASMCFENARAHKNPML